MTANATTAGGDIIDTVPREALGLVRHIPGKGRGLFAIRSLQPGDVIEIAPAVTLSSDDCDRIEATALGPYYFAHPQNGEEGLFILGRASVVNHAEQPNAQIEWRHDPETGWSAVLRALRSIAGGEEITRLYRCPPWFQVVR